MKMKSQTAKLN